ncbi:MAG: CDP-diacylglycerol--glycerol-3-phosphate 3-phosphatidyltransferase [Clostridia bacterium]|nr:CDP-diacylglycerol--glycerol-3-phosphate 3-phosphatidyltransferase [Clostridia bacterium]
MNIPNFLTILRLFMVPAFILAYLHGGNGRFLAAGLFVLAGLTDVLDGYLARKLNQITDFGKLADPAADKLMQLSALLCLCIARRLPLWILLVYAVKEVLQVLGGLRLLNIRKYVVYSKWSGKIASVLLFVVITVIIMTTEQQIPLSAATWMMVICLIATVIAFFDYVSMYINIRDARHPKDQRRP